MIEKDSLTQCFKRITAIVNFPTRLQGMSSTMIDNIFLDTSKTLKHTVLPFFNGLSDHDTQLLILKDLNLQVQDYHIYTTRDINDYSINEFKTNLSNET